MKDAFKNSIYSKDVKQLHSIHLNGLTKHVGTNPSQ